MDLRKYLPTQGQLNNSRFFRSMGRFTQDRDLWHMNRHSVSEAVFWGAICCFLPMPFQMVPCLVLCILRRCNIPIAIAVVWVSNPITMAPMMYFAYEIGTLITGDVVRLDVIELSWHWLAERLAEVWLPLILGCLLCGFTTGVLGYLTVQWYYWARLRRLQAKRNQRVNGAKP